MSFIRFEALRPNQDGTESQVGHLYVKAADINAVYDPSGDPTGAQRDADASKHRTLLSVGAQTFAVRHHVSSVLQSINTVLNGSPSKSELPVRSDMPVVRDDGPTAA